MLLFYWRSLLYFPPEFSEDPDTFYPLFSALAPAQGECCAGVAADPDLYIEAVRQRAAAVTSAQLSRQSGYPERKKAQSWLALPPLPTTTIGSFPQTAEIRKTRRDFKNCTISEAAYTAAMQNEIRQCIEKQEQLGLDVLVHGEAERNDMVEYFGQQLGGFCFTQNGWVQSYGSRCVKRVFQQCLPQWSCPIWRDQYRCKA